MPANAEQMRTGSACLLAALLLFGWEITCAMADAEPWLRLALTTAIIVCLWIGVSRGYGTWHPFTLYLSLSTLYVMSPLVEVGLLGNTFGFDPRRVGLVTDMGVGFLLAATIGFMLVGESSRARDVPIPPEGASASPNVPPSTSYPLAFCTLLVAVYVAMTVSRYGLSIGTLTRAELYSTEFTTLSVVRSVLVAWLGCTAATIAIASGTAPLRRQPAFLALLLVLTPYLAGDLLILGDRRLALVAIIGTISLFKRRPLTPGQLLAGAALGISLVFYGFVRNQPPSQWIAILSTADLLRSVNPASQEFGLAALISGAIDNLAQLPSDFPTYLQAIPQLVPRAMLPDRPLAPSEWFVWTYFPILARAGAGFAFNAVIEAQANGGAWALAAVGATTGAAIGFLGKLRWRFVPIGVPLAIHVFVFSMRMDLASLLRTLLLELFAVGSLIVLTELCSRATTALRSRQTATTS